MIQDERLSHLDAIDQRLRHERARVAAAKTTQEREWREHNVRMIDKEREGEVEFLKKTHGIDMTPVSLDDILDDDLLKELGM